MKSKLPSTQPLNKTRDFAHMRPCDQLFAMVEKDQGFAFISDGMDQLTDKEFFGRTRAALYRTRRTAKMMEEFLRYHDEY